jgi:uncharacterized protein YecE (DUF72 family)
MNLKSSPVYIGTSGWHYEHWREVFYPKKTANKDFFAHYKTVFNTVEINNTFYRLPEKETLEKWRVEAPRGFIFSVKASRYITHMKKLKEPEASVETFFERIESLGEAQGPILFQLPPRWNVNVSRLEAFLSALPPNFQYAFEFRDARWFTGAVYQTLHDHNAALCLYAMGDYTSPKEVTADFVYVRLHGPEGEYGGSYSKAELSGWAGAFSTWSRGGRTIYCYFDNDESGFAAADASTLKNMLSSG